MKRIIISLALVLSLSAAAERVLTLDECRQMALENNVKIRNAQLSTEAARQLRKEAFTKYFPEISASAMAFTTNHGALRHDFKGSLPVPEIGPIPAGVTIDYDFGFSLMKKGITAGVGFVQPVFLGGEIYNSNQLAQVGEAVAELQSRQSADQVRLTVEQYFWQLAILKSKLATVDKVLAMIDTLDRQVTVAVNAGVVLRNDLLEVQLKQGEMQTARIELTNGIAIISTLLAQYIGLGVDQSIDIDATITEGAPVEMPDGIYADPQTALTATADYGLLRQQLRAAELDRKITVGKNLPKIAVGAGYFYHDLFDQSQRFAAMFATVIVPISDWWGGSHAIKRSKIKETIARNELDDYSQLLQIKMRNAWNDLTAAQQKINVARRSIDQAKENLRLNELCYHAGTSTITDLLKAQSLFRQANDQYVEALGDFRIRTVAYLQATGR